MADRLHVSRTLAALIGASLGGAAGVVQPPAEDRRRAAAAPVSATAAPKGVQQAAPEQRRVQYLPASSAGAMDRLLAAKTVGQLVQGTDGFPEIDGLSQRLSPASLEALTKADDKRARKARRAAELAARRKG